MNKHFISTLFNFIPSKYHKDLILSDLFNRTISLCLFHTTSTKLYDFIHTTINIDTSLHLSRILWHSKNSIHLNHPYFYGISHRLLTHYSHTSLTFIENSCPTNLVKYVESHITENVTNCLRLLRVFTDVYSHLIRTDSLSFPLSIINTLTIFWQARKSFLSLLVRSLTPSRPTFTSIISLLLSVSYLSQSLSSHVFEELFLNHLSLHRGLSESERRELILLLSALTHALRHIESKKRRAQTMFINLFNSYVEAGVSDTFLLDTIRARISILEERPTARALPAAFSRNLRRTAAPHSPDSTSSPDSHSTTAHSPPRA